MIITFDDGYEDNFTRAYPILKENGFPCTFFLATGKINTTEIPWWDEIYARLKELHNKELENHHLRLNGQLLQYFTKFKCNPSYLFAHLNSCGSDTIRSLIKSLREHTHLSKITLSSANKFLNWEQVTSMKDIISFGSHTHSHIILNTISQDEIKHELAQSKQELEQRLYKEVICLSYPAGHYTRDIICAVIACGYRYAVTQDKGVNELNNFYTLKRINIWEGSTTRSNGKFSKSLFALKLSGL